MFYADTCASYVHPVFNPVTPYRYLLPSVYLFMADISNPYLFCVVADLDLSQHHSASHPAGPNGQIAPLLGAGDFDTICTAVCKRRDSSSACRRCRLEPTRQCLRMVMCEIFDWH